MALPLEPIAAVTIIICVLLAIVVIVFVIIGLTKRREWTEFEDYDPLRATQMHQGFRNKFPSLEILMYVLRWVFFGSIKTIEFWKKKLKLKTKNFTNLLDIFIIFSWDWIICLYTFKDKSFFLYSLEFLITLYLFYRNLWILIDFLFDCLIDSTIFDWLFLFWFLLLNKQIKKTNIGSYCLSNLEVC